MRTALTIAVLLVAPASVSAQASPLAQAEAAYLEVDFDGTYSHALAALRGGGNGPRELVRIYQLLGIASSALGREDEAREFFVRMLGLDRDAELDASVPPRLRDPYLEARGVWAARQGTLGVRAGLDRARGTMRFEITDPTGMARRVVIYARPEGEARYATQDSESRSLIEVPVAGAAGADRIEYYVELLDEHRNVLRSEGTAFEPRVVGRERVAASAAPAAGPSILEEPVFWIVVGAVVLAGAGVTVGVVADQRSRIGAQTSIRIGID